MGFGRALPLFVKRLVGETNGPIRQIRTVMEQFLRIGVITQAHGIRGEVKVYPTTDSPERFKEVKRVIIQSKKGEIETEIKGVKFLKNMAIVQFACFDSPEEASKYRQADVMIYREDAQPLEEGEYYTPHDVVQLIEAMNEPFDVEVGMCPSNTIMNEVLC